MNHRVLSQVHFPVQYVEVTESLVRARGGRVAEVRERCGLPPLDSAQSPTMIDGHQLMESLKIGALHCLPGEPPSLQVLRHFPLTAHGTLGMASITSQTVREALDVALRYQALVMPAFEMQALPVTAEGVTVRVEQVVDMGPFNALMAELVIGVLRNVSPYLGSVPWSVRVQFAHSPMGPTADYDAFFGEPVHFQAPHHAFTVPHAVLDTPLITGNRATQASLEALLKKQVPTGARPAPVSQQVRAFVSGWLRKGQVPPAQSVAEALAMSPRTLSRKLADEGVTLSDLIEGMRIAQAEHLMLDGHRTIQEVAHAVGFADASSFARAFKRGTGHSPVSWRAQRR